MIIFNLYCIPVAILITSALLLMNSVVKIEDSQMELLAVGIVSTIVGGICEWIGLAARLFFLPIWLIGMAVTAYQTFQLWGWYVIVPIGVCVVGLFIFSSIMSRREREIWANAPHQLEEAIQCMEAGDRPAMWDALESAFFVPEFVDFDIEIMVHNKEVVELLSTALSEEEQISQDIVNRLTLVRNEIGEEQDATNPSTEVLQSLQFVKLLIANRGQVVATEEGA